MKAGISVFIRNRRLAIRMCLTAALTGSSFGQAPTWQSGNAVATGQYSTALGLTITPSPDPVTTASGHFSLAIGYGSLAAESSSLSIGYLTTASGIGSNAIGYDTLAAGQQSTAMGYGTIANGFQQFVVGAYNLSQGITTATSRGDNDHLFIIGNGTAETRKNAMVVTSKGDLIVTGSVTASGGLAVTGPVTANGMQLLTTTVANSSYVPVNSTSTRAGAGSTAGDYALAFGTSAVAGNDSVAVGNSAVAGDHAVAVGSNVIAGGVGSVTLGRNIVYTGYGAPGNSNLAVGIGLDTYYGSNVVLVGQNSFANGDFVTSLGHANSTWGMGASAFGYVNVASGDYATAVGAQSSAYGERSTALGYGVVANSYGQVALGYYNAMAPSQSYNSPVPTDELLTLGNGTSYQARSNALVIKKNGDAKLAGVLTLPQGARVPAGGDISMGAFTAGTPPTP